MIAHHGDAGGGRDNDGFGVCKLLDEALKKRHGFGLVAGVVVHLAAAGLAWWKVDGVPEALENAHDGLAGVREERVVIAGDKERDAQDGSLGRTNFNRDYICGCPFGQIRWHGIEMGHCFMRRE